MNVKSTKHNARYGVCYDCKLVVPIQRPYINHNRHRLLTLLTLGLWSPIWIYHTLANRHIGWCARCGSHHVAARGADAHRPPRRIAQRYRVGHRPEA